MFARLVVLIALLGVVSGFMAPANRQSNFQMLFNFGKKPTSTPAAPAAKAPAAAPKASLKAATTPAGTTKPTGPVKPSSVGKLLATTKPTGPVKPIPVGKPVATTKPTGPVKPVPVLPAKPAAITKPTGAVKPIPVGKGPAGFTKPTGAVKPSPVASSGFLGGLVGSDVEAPDFDPFQLSAGRDEETIAWYRAAELKHGRIAMLAALGLSVQPAFHLPDAVFDSTLGYGAVTKLYQERPEAIWQILLALAAVETFSLFKNGQGSAGDLGFDPLNLQSKLYSDPEKFQKVQLQELKHGRLAMWGSSALLLQEYVTGYGPYDQLLPH
eukprot:CAMPEP_0173163066 /NCGR_PEP_ID=MMETSP1105-20130129/19695_1 /TAXON_ID=2985 /ORGANISM="Ochromonas sp., Strain BG-1" /LENGTH=324 /DNA_ID=CAMNT_0014083043 /DNA_START=78 /DNA_END=1052 /DNA_ORIENTATION=+